MTVDDAMKVAELWSESHAEPTGGMTRMSMREWIDHWGSGPNWSDPAGLTVPIAKTTLLWLIEQADALPVLASEVSRLRESERAARERADATEAQLSAQCKALLRLADAWGAAGRRLPAADRAGGAVEVCATDLRVLLLGESIKWTASSEGLVGHLTTHWGGLSAGVGPTDDGRWFWVLEDHAEGTAATEELAKAATLRALLSGSDAGGGK